MPRKIGLGLLQDFTDRLAVRVRQVGELFTPVLAVEHLPQSLKNVLFGQIGQGVEGFGVDEVTARIPKQPLGEVQLSQGPTLLIPRGINEELRALAAVTVS